MQGVREIESILGEVFSRVSFLKVSLAIASFRVKEVATKREKFVFVNLQLEIFEVMPILL